MAAILIAASLTSACGLETSYAVTPNPKNDVFLLERMTIGGGAAGSLSIEQWIAGDPAAEKVPLGVFFHGSQTDASWTGDYTINICEFAYERPWTRSATVVTAAGVERTVTITSRCNPTEQEIEAGAPPEALEGSPYEEVDEAAFEARWGRLPAAGRPSEPTSPDG